MTADEASWRTATDARQTAAAPVCVEHDLHAFETIGVIRRQEMVRQEYRPGLFFWGELSKGIEHETPYGHILAIDVEIAKIAWDVRTDHPMLSGITCPASGLVITGPDDRKMLVLDADTGSILHTFTARSACHGVPVVYSVKGKDCSGFPNGWAARSPEISAIPQ